MNPDQPTNPADQPPAEPLDQTVAEPLEVQPVADQPDQPASTVDEPPVSWTADEYIHLEKNGLWYVLFGLVVIGLVASDVFWLKSWTFSVLVIVMAAAVIVYIRRPPRTIQYVLSGKQGLYIGERLYQFGEFKAFGLIRDGQEHSIMLIPLKRFSPGVSVYFPAEVGEQIVDILGSRLPMETLQLDMIDIIVRRLRL